MRKLVILLLTLVVIAGCATTTPMEPASSEPATAPSEPATAPVTEPTTVERKTQPTPAPQPEPSQVIVETQEPTSSEPADIPAAPSAEKTYQAPEDVSPYVKDLLTRADTKVRSFSFTLAPPPDQLARDEWKVRGDKIRIDLYDDNYVEPDTYYDTIFIDTTKKTAVGICLSQRTTRCAEAGQRFPLSYADVMEKTPYQWVKSVTGTPKLISTQLLYDRKADVIQYKPGAEEITMWIDQFSGLAIRVQKGEDKNSRVEFRYLAINSVTEDEVTPPPAK